MDYLILLVFGFALMYLLVVLPQRRRAAAHARMVAQVGVGAEVVTIGGIYGRVTAVGADDVTLEVSPGTHVRVAKRAIAGVEEPGADDASTEPESLAESAAEDETRR